jgi:LemA protein
VKTSRSQVENQYQRRLDLIPNLVSTVQWYANFEKSTLQAVIEARAKATQTNVNVNDAAWFANFQASQWELSSALSRLMVVVEQYPDLKANQNFLELQSQLEWTENRISVERKRYNDTVNIYNKYILMFPSNVIAGFFKFVEAQLFKAEEWANKSPDVSFENKVSTWQQTVEDLKAQLEAEKVKIEIEKAKQELNNIKWTWN